MRADKFIVNTMKDVNEMNKIKHTLMEKHGINAVRMDMQANTITIDYDEDNYNSESLRSLVGQQGLDVKTIM